MTPGEQSFLSIKLDEALKPSRAEKMCKIVKRLAFDAGIQIEH